MNNKVISIEFFRFIFILQICLWHSHLCSEYIKHGYLAVEFFFILSGYLLYKSYKHRNSRTVLDFTINKLKSFYPKIFVAYILFGFIFKNSITEHPERVINDLTLLSGTGLVYGPGINSPIWYVSVLVIGGGILYASLKKIEEIALSILFPIVILLVYSYILGNNNFCLELWETVGCFHIPFWRGVAGMCLGCILCKFQMLKSEAIDKKYVKQLNILFVFALLGCLIPVISSQCYDGYIVISYAIVILCCFSKVTIPNTLLTQKIWMKLGAISFDMYILHFYVLRIVYKLENLQILDKGNWINIWIYIILLVSISFLFDFLFKHYIKKYTAKIF